MPLPTAIEIVARLEAIRLRLGQFPESLREVVDGGRFGLPVVPRKSPH